MYRAEKANLSDLNEILLLQKIAFREEGFLYGKIPPLTQTLDELTEEFENTVILKVVYNGRIIGSVRRQGEKIGRLMVLPEYRNQGIGRLLLKEIEFGQDRYELFTKGSKNIEFYKNSGYKIFKEENGFVYMEKYNG